MPKDFKVDEAGLEGQSRVRCRDGRGRGRRAVTIAGRGRRTEEEVRICWKRGVTGDAMIV